MSQLITVSVYRPEYNPETKQYQDYNPIPSRAKGFHYRCLCTNAPKTFTKSFDFTLHFKSKSHRDYVANYEINTKDLTDANERIKQLQITLELKHQQVLRLERENQLLFTKKYSYQSELD
jgi:hypothetical protein